MDNKIKKVLGTSISRETSNTDIFNNININSNERLLPPSELNRVLDVKEQFNIERQESTFFRVYGKINPLVSNVLFNTTGSINCWQIFNTPLFTNVITNNETEVLSYQDSIKKHLREIDGWFGYYNPILTGTGFCEFIDMEPSRGRFDFISRYSTSMVPAKNWEITITYPYSSNSSHDLVNGGILLVDKKTVYVGGRQMIAIATPIRHNLEIGSIVRIKRQNINRDYEVKRLGLDDGSFPEYYFCLDLLDINIDLAKMNKLYNNVESVYYFRKFKKIKTRYFDEIQNDDYDITKLSFNETIFSDENTQFIFNEDININELVDNLGRPLTEIYFTVIKTEDNGFFTKIISGIEAPEILNLNTGRLNQTIGNIPIVQKMHTGPTTNVFSNNNLEYGLNINWGDYYGDIVEYNVTTLNEVILSDIMHRFNTVNRETTGNSIVGGPRYEGYYYKPLHKIQLRRFSDYIEEGNASTVNIPSYATNLGDGRIIWRDILPYGQNEPDQIGLNYPFVNGCHYIYTDIDISLKRQDPFDFWDLFYSGQPSDPIGNELEDNFTVNRSENVC